MALIEELENRSGNKCEFCSSTINLKPYLVEPKTEKTTDDHVYACETCYAQLEDKTIADPNHWRCLNDSMWNENYAVKVVSYRMLHHLRTEGWPQDLLDMIYLDEAELDWAKDGIVDENPEAIIHRDNNGAVLNHGDSITVIKDLNVRGSRIAAKRGTAVRNITLVNDNAEQIEGRVEGQQIVILTQYVKKNG